MIVVPTIPHTGTHFMRDHLLKGVESMVWHPYDEDLDKIYNLISGGAACIIPRRDLDQIVASWQRHGKNVDDFAGRSLDEWLYVQNSIAVHAAAKSQLYYLNIDHPGARDRQLAAINRNLGLSLDARGWPVIRQADE